MHVPPTQQGSCAKDITFLSFVCRRHPLVDKNPPPNFWIFVGEDSLNSIAAEKNLSIFVHRPRFRQHAKYYY